MMRVPVTNEEVDLFDLLCETFDEMSDLRDSYEILKGDLEIALDDIDEEIKLVDEKITECRKAFRLFRRRPPKASVSVSGERYQTDEAVISCIPEDEDDELPF